MEAMVYKFEELNRENQYLAGGKGGTLGRLYQLGYAVPRGFVIMPEAFNGETLKDVAWIQIIEQINNMRSNNKDISFAIRSSSISEDSAEASFAGEFDTVLDVKDDKEIQEAVLKVVRSRESSRVDVYSKAKGIETSHQIAVVVQQMLASEISGVLFTIDPVSGNQSSMIGNFVYGLGEKLVSGESNGEIFKINRRDGSYKGPQDLSKYSRQFYNLGEKLEKDLNYPQDIEWAISKGKLFLL